MKTVTFNKKKLTVEISQYSSNGRPSIELFSKQGEPWIVASVNIPELNIPEGHTFIRNYAENSGILEALCNQGIVQDTGRAFPSGYVKVNLVKILTN